MAAKKEKGNTWANTKQTPKTRFKPNHINIYMKYKYSKPQFKEKIVKLPKNIRPIYICLQETNFKYKNGNRLEAKA